MPVWGGAALRASIRSKPTYWSRKLRFSCQICWLVSSAAGLLPSSEAVETGSSPTLRAVMPQNQGKDPTEDPVYSHLQVRQLKAMEGKGLDHELGW